MIYASILINATIHGSIRTLLDIIPGGKEYTVLPNARIVKKRDPAQGGPGFTAGRGGLGGRGARGGSGGRGGFNNPIFGTIPGANRNDEPLNLRDMNQFPNLNGINGAAMATDER